MPLQVAQMGLLVCPVRWQTRQNFAPGDIPESSKFFDAGSADLLAPDNSHYSSRVLGADVMPDGGIRSGEGVAYQRESISWLAETIEGQLDQFAVHILCRR